MDHLAKYLYCIIRCPEESSFPDAAPIGDAPVPVYTVPQRGLAAVVSDSPASRYETTRANLLAHERVQEVVMGQFTLLPVRFGTVTEATDPTPEIRRLLEKRVGEFDRLLDEMEDKVELGLKAYWRDEAAVFAELLAHDRAIKRLRDALQGQPPQATHFERARLGEMVKEALERKRRAEAAALLSPLRRIARETVEHQAVLDRMLLSAAFLVDRAREQEFDRAVGELQAQQGDRVSFKYVGPVPPYNFVNITVNWREL